MEKKRSYIKREKWITIAEQKAKKNGGKLPSVQILINDGYWPLYQMMRRHPSSFAHIEQEKIRSTPQ